MRGEKHEAKMGNEELTLRHVQHTQLNEKGIVQQTCFNGLDSCRLVVRLHSWNWQISPNQHRILTFSVVFWTLLTFNVFLFFFFILYTSIKREKKGRYFKTFIVYNKVASRELKKLLWYRAAYVADEHAILEVENYSTHKLNNFKFLFYVLMCFSASSFFKATKNCVLVISLNLQFSLDDHPSIYDDNTIGFLCWSSTSWNLISPKNFFMA